MTSEFDLSKIEAMSRAELINDIGEDARTIISALQIAREPDARVSYLQFALEDRNFAIPKTVLEAFDHDSVIEDVVIETSMDSTSSNANITFMFTAVDRDGRLSTIVIDKESGEYVANMVVGKDTDPMPLLSKPEKGELTAFLASIFAHNKRGDYRIFEALNLDDLKTVRNIEEALEKYADWYSSRNAFALGNSQTPNIEFGMQDGSVNDVKIVRTHSGNSTALSLDFDHSLLGNDFDMADLDGARVYEFDEDGMSNPIECSTEQLVTFDDFIKELTSDFANSRSHELSSSQLDEIDPDPGNDHIDRNGKPFRSRDEFKD